jgi:uncharacterized protein (DUF488 family)
LVEYGIEALVDVRSSPYSQYSPQFNRETLAKTLEASGVEYAFAGEYLGGRPRDPSLYRSGEMPVGKGSNYLELVDYEKVAQQPFYQKGIARLLQIAGENRTVIMCSEEDPAHCHRQHLIAQTLLGQGVEVLHIRGEGLEEAAVQPRQMSLF